VALGAHEGAPSSGAGHGQACGDLDGDQQQGYWRLSRTLATQTAMTTDCLYAQGLMIICGLWMEAHGYA
jgi:hypothetical protein